MPSRAKPRAERKRSPVTVPAAAVVVAAVVVVAVAVAGEKHQKKRKERGEEKRIQADESRECKKVPREGGFERLTEVKSEERLGLGPINLLPARIVS